MYLGQTPETVTGGGWFETVWDKVTAALPGVAQVITAARQRRGYQGPTDYDYSRYADRSAGIMTPARRFAVAPAGELPGWFWPATIGLGGVAVIALMMGGGRRGVRR